jgi:hypothetical protein
MTYPGGKGAVFQRIINLMPQHRVYIETHAGGAAVALNKRPARLNYLIDLDPEPLANIAIPDAARWRLVNADAVTWLRRFEFQGDEFIYCDPPYLMSTRRQHRQLYRYELTKADHIKLLDCLTSLPCMVMISGYYSDLYASRLVSGWRTETFEAMTRGGQMATEWLWMNYPAPVALHDYRHLGDNFRERERIKRKKQRWAAKWANLPRLERQAILSAIAEIDDVAGGGDILSPQTTMPAIIATTDGGAVSPFVTVQPGHIATNGAASVSSLVTIGSNNDLLHP